MIYFNTRKSEELPGVVVMFGIEGLDSDEVILVAFFVIGTIAAGFIFLWPTDKKK